MYQVKVNFLSFRFSNSVNYVNLYILGLHVRILNGLEQLLDVTCLYKALLWS